jgi:hypothetical protein
MKLIRIEQNCIEVTWPYVKEFVQKPLDYTLGERDIDDIYFSLIHGQTQLWVGAKEDEGILGITVTRINDYPQYRSLCFALVGSVPHTIHKWLGYAVGDDSPIIEWAKEQVIKTIELGGREGWLKYLKNYDFKKYSVKLVRELE